MNEDVEWVSFIPLVNMVAKTGDEAAKTSLWAEMVFSGSDLGGLVELGWGEFVELWLLLVGFGGDSGLI